MEFNHLYTNCTCQNTSQSMPSIHIQMWLDVKTSTNTAYLSDCWESSWILSLCHIAILQVTNQSQYDNLCRSTELKTGIVYDWLPISNTFRGIWCHSQGREQIDLEEVIHNRYALILYSRFKSPTTVVLVARFKLRGFEVLRAVVVKSTIFWDITPCSSLMFQSNISLPFLG
jgi:hypothetical protein